MLKKKCYHTLVITVFCGFLLAGTGHAQENGPLMFSVEFGFTLGGAVGGAGIGFIVWLTDPLGPVSISEAIKNGVIIGTVVGAAFGFYVLYESVIFPDEKEDTFELYNELLGEHQESGKKEVIARQDEWESIEAFEQQKIPVNLLNF